MKKYLLFILALGLGGASYAQTPSTGRIINGLAANRPTCGSGPPNAQNGDIYNDTDDVNSFKCFGGVWSALGGGGGGSPSAGTPLQKGNGSGGFVNTAVTESGSTLITAEDAQNAGPNPRVDVRAYNARAVSSVPSTAGTITGGNNVAAVSSATGFQINDGVAFLTAGATNTMSTPSAPSVTPASAQAGTGTGMIVGSPAGATTYQYCIVAEDLGGGLTACSANTSISTGQASLGQQSVSISSWSRSRTVVTVTTSSAHTLSVGSQFAIDNGADGSILGTYRVISVPDTTHFTFSNLNDTAAGAAASGSAGGTVYWFNSNHITWSQVTGAFRYHIYGRTSGSMAYIGTSTPEPMQSLSGNPLLRSFDDFGATMMTPPNRPPGVPSTPPVSATNDTLVTTITNIAGNNITLASNAGNNASSSSFSFDNAPNIKTAATAAAANNYSLYFPFVASGSFFYTNSTLTLSPANTLTIVQAGEIFASNPWVFGSVQWVGEYSPQGIVTFGFDHYPQFFTNALPGIYLQSASTVSTFSHLNIASQNANQAILVLEDANAHIPSNTFDHVAFNTSTSGTNDYMGIGYLYRGANGGGGQNNGQFFRHCNFVGGPVQAAYNTLTPLVQFNAGAIELVKMENTFLDHRGMLFRGGGQLAFDWLYDQGAASQPLVTVWNDQGVASTTIEIHHAIEDTMQTPLVANLGFVSGVIKVIDNVGPTPGYPLITESVNPNASDSSSSFMTFLHEGRNTNSDEGNRENYAVGPVAAIDGILSTAPSQITVETKNGNTLWGNANQIAIGGVAMAAPGETGPTSGGAIPVGANTFSIAPVGPTGGEIAPVSPSSTACVTTSGNQTCALTWTAYSGATGYDIYRNGFSMGCAAPFISGGTTTSATISTGGCGQSAPGLPGSGLPALTKNGVVTQSTVTAGGGFTSTATAPSLTANRTETIPDVTGTRAELTGSLTSGHCLQNGATSGQVTDTGAACGGSPASPSLSVQYNNAGAFGAISGNVSGQVLTATNSAVPSFQSNGIADGNGGAAVSATPYLVQCDSATTVIDRSHIIRFTSGASVVNIPLSSTSGCTGNMSFVLVNDSVTAGVGLTIQPNSGSTDTFNVYNGASKTTVCLSSCQATNFVLTQGQSVTMTQGASGIWEARVTTGPGVGNGASPALAWYLGPQCPQSNTGQCFYSPANTQQSVACIWTAASPIINCGTNVANVTGAVASNVATYTTNGLVTIPSAWIVGDSLVVHDFLGSDTFFNQTCTVTAVTTTSVSCALTHANAPSTSQGVVVDTNRGPFVVGDIGKQAAGWKSCNAFIGDGTGQITTTGAPTISGFTNSSTITLSANAANSVSTNTGCFVWGTPDDSYAAALESAYITSSYCPRVYMAAANYMFTKPHFYTNPTACANLGTQAPVTPPGNVFYSSGMELNGRGAGATVWYLMPNFPNGDTCSRGANQGSSYSGLGTACFAMPPLSKWQDFQITGGGNLLDWTTQGGHGTTALVYGSISTVENVTCINMGGWESSGAVIGFEAGWQMQFIQYNNSGCGSQGILTDTGQGAVTGMRVRVENSNSIDVNVGSAGSGSDNSFTCYDCGFYGTRQTTVPGTVNYLVYNNGGSVLLYHPQLDFGENTSQTKQAIAYNAAGSNPSLTIRDATVKMSGGFTTNSGIVNNISGGTVVLQNVVLNTALGATGKSYQDVAGANLYNDPGTIFGSSNTFSGLHHHVESGTCTFAASTTCTVTFGTSFGSSSPNLIITPVNPGGITVTVTALSATSATLTASGSTSIAVGWNASIN